MAQLPADSRERLAKGLKYQAEMLGLVGPLDLERINHWADELAARMRCRCRENVCRNLKLLIGVLACNLGRIGNLQCDVLV